MSEKEQKTLKEQIQELIDILALPNMGDEGRKQKLIAIKAWQIKFLSKFEGLVAELEQRLENEQGIVTLTDNDETEDVLIGIKEVLVLLDVEKEAHK